MNDCDDFYQWQDTCIKWEIEDNDDSENRERDVWAQDQPGRF